MINSIRKKILFIFNVIKSLNERQKIAYRVVSIQQDEAENYFAVIQTIGKATTFIAKPEELLMDDEIVNLFSQQDVRNLTYLGYLGINSPKYKILAQKLSEKNDQTVFAILKKGETKHHVITAAEISTNTEILNGLNQKDAHKIGFIAGSEQIILENREKARLIIE